MKIVKQTIAITLISIISLLVLGCGVLYATGGFSPFKLEGLSELVAQKATIDSNNQTKLVSTLFLIRQSYEIIPTKISLAPWLTFLILTNFGIFLMLIQFKKWSKISWPILISGFICWFAIQIFNSNGISIVDFLFFFGGQFTFLSIASIFYLTIVLSSAIPNFLLQLGLGKDTSESKRRWGILGFFYALNLTICLGNLLANWDIHYYTPSLFFWLISISIHLYTQFKKSSEFPFFDFGISLISLTGLTLFLISSNDAGIRSIEIWNLMCQIIMIVLYPLFLISNFRPLLIKNLPVHRVVDRPHIFPIAAIYVGILILGAAWVFALNGGVYHQIMAGKYNLDGDLAQGLQDKFLAEVYYKKAMMHSRLNTKSNLSLALLAKNQNDVEREAYYLATAMVKKPNELALIGISSIYQRTNHVFEALFELQKGFQKMPGSAPIATQLAYIFEQLDQRDSAKYYFQKAYLNDENELTNSNLAYAAVKYSISNPTFKWAKDQKNHGYQANLYAFNLVNKWKTKIDFVPSNFELTADFRDLAMVYNSVALFKSQQPKLPLEQWAKNEKIRTLFPEIDIACAMQLYYHDDPLKALEKMALTISIDTSNKTAGILAILEFWHQAQLIPIGKLKINNQKQAEDAIKKHPFQVDVIERTIPYFDSKTAYQVALSALHWNEKIAFYYPIYALQALKIGEIDYAKEAMNKLNQLDSEIFHATIRNFEKELLLAEKKRLF